MNIQIKSDKTFIVDFNGNPFHITPEYPTAKQYGEDMTYTAMKAYAQAHPDEVTEYQEPIIETPEISEEEQAAIDITRLEKEAQAILPAIQAGIDVENNQQKLVDIMLEIEELKGNI